MNIILDGLINKNDNVAVAVSGGSDSMALLHFLHTNKKQLGINVFAINIEHGIRGNESKADSLFVKNYCDKNGITLYFYEVNSIDYAKKNKLSIEESARKLRYQCFYDAIATNKCDKIATAHHKRDNAETIAFNIFRGAGTKGLIGIPLKTENNIIRPFLETSKEEIEEYIKLNSIDFVVDKTNYCEDYTRNFLRLNVMPKLKEVFSGIEDSLCRLSQIARTDEDFLQQSASQYVLEENNVFKIKLPIHSALLSRASIMILKSLGVKKDWQKKHIDSIISLSTKENGKQLDLLGEITVIKEYDNLVFYKKALKDETSFLFGLGEYKVKNAKISIKKASPTDLKSGLFGDLDKIPKTSVIRRPKDNDFIKKFGGGTKKLCDYFTDIKFPKRLRNEVFVLADDMEVLVVFGICISSKIRVDKDTKNIIQFICEANTNE